MLNYMQFTLFWLFFLNHLFFILLCERVFCLHVYVYHVCAWCPQGQEEGIRSLALELQMVWLIVCMLGIKPGSSKRTASAL